MTARPGRRVLLSVVALALALGPSVGLAQAASSRGTVYVATEPRLAGVSIGVDGRTVVTGSNGTVAVSVPDLNDIANRVSLLSTSRGSRHTLEQAFIKQAPHSAPRESHITVGIDVTSSTTLVIDPGTTGAKASDIRGVRLHAITGDVVDVDLRKTHQVALLSRKARQSGSGTSTQVVTWTVDSVTASGGTVYKAGRDAFDPFAEGIWTLHLVPVAGTVLVETVPRTPGATFTIDGSTFTTDAEGRGSAPVTDLNGVEDRLALGKQKAGSTAAALVGVSRTKPTAAFQRHLIAGLAVTRTVAFRFTDLNAKVVPNNRVTSLELTGAGASVTLSPTQVRLGAPLVVRKARMVGGQWVAQDVTYSVTKVGVEGGDAVFAGQQKLVPATDGTVTVALSVFDLQVTFRDVLFGTHVTAVADLTRPDGVTVPVAVSPDGVASMPGLVRGEYVLASRAAIVGGNTRVLVSRPSVVDLKVVTFLDVAVVTVLMVGLCVSLVWVGRAWARRSAARQLGRLP